MPSNGPVEILMIGHFAKDRLVFDGVPENASGGAVYYGSVALRRMGVSVAVATRLHRNDFGLLGELEEAGVRVFAREAPHTSGIENVYDTSDMERRVCRTLAFAGPFAESDIPDLKARIIAIVPIIAGEVDEQLVRSLAGRGPLAMDVQGFVRVREGDSLVFRRPPDLDRVLSRVTYLKADQAEAELITGRSDVEEAARALADLGPSEVVVTRSSGVTVWAEGRIHRAAFAPRSLIGRTGRGDTCIASYLGRRLTAPPDDAARLAAAITSLKQERRGPWAGPMEEALRWLEAGGDRRRPDL